MLIHAAQVHIDAPNPLLQIGDILLANPSTNELSVTATTVSVSGAVSVAGTVSANALTANGIAMTPKRMKYVQYSGASDALLSLVATAVPGLSYTFTGLANKLYTIRAVVRAWSNTGKAKSIKIQIVKNGVLLSAGGFLSHQSSGTTDASQQIEWSGIMTGANTITIKVFQYQPDAAHWKYRSKSSGKETSHMYIFEEPYGGTL